MQVVDVGGELGKQGSVSEEVRWRRRKGEYKGTFSQLLLDSA